MKPLAERIDSFVPRRKIIYRCFKCNSSFAILGDQTKFCHNCGTPIEWEDVKLRLDDDFSTIWVKNGTRQNIDDYEKIFIDELNIEQLGEAYMSLYNEDGSPKNCSYCIYAIDEHNCKIPESERNTINIPRHLNFCHSARCDKFKEWENKKSSYRKVGEL